MPGSICVWATPEPLRHGQTAVDDVPEATQGCFHRLLPAGPPESAVHRHVCHSAVHSGAKGKVEKENIPLNSLVYSLVGYLKLSLMLLLR